MNAWKRITLACLSLLALGLAPVGAALAQVKVTAANPSSAYQGTVSLDVVVSGSGFDRTAKAQYFVSGTTNTGGITVMGTRFNSATELVTTIAVADTALLANFDIVVTLDSGRKGKGTTLFAVTAKPTKTTPTYPQARFYHAITSNGGTTSATSRLYMFGGSAGDGTDLADLWSYANAGSRATWTFISGGTLTPSARHVAGWSCGGGQCVLVNGWRGASWVKETWIFNESTGTWSQVSCGRRVLCPSERAAPATAFDPGHGIHVLFGGEGASDPMLLGDTWLFSGATKTWQQASGGAPPAAREAAAAVFVPGVGVVMFGGWGNPCCVTTLNDMHVWNGTAWAPVTSTLISDPPRAVPTLAMHSMAWDATRNALIVTGGFLTAWHTPNTETWYVTISKSAAGAWQAVWALASGIGCQYAAGSPPDSVVHPGAMMARDPIGLVQVFFGGESSDTASAYGNTVECR